MHDTFLVRGGESIRKRRTNVEYAVQWQSMLRDDRLERLSLNKFHRQEMDAFRFLDGVNRHDVWVVQSCNGSRFSLEARQKFGIARHWGEQHFERHVAAQLGVRGPIDFAHTARTNRGSYLIVAEPASDQSDLLTRTAQCPTPSPDPGSSAASPILRSPSQTSSSPPDDAYPRCPVSSR